MKKKHFILTAAVLCGIFLFCQFLLHRRTSITPVPHVGPLSVLTNGTLSRVWTIIDFGMLYDERVPGHSSYNLLKSIIVHTHEKTSDHNTDTTAESPSLLAVKAFSDTCLSEGLPVFVVEPRILEALISNNSVSNSCKQWCPLWCRYLCTDAEITTFGVLGHFWRKTRSVLTVLSKKQFSTVSFNQPAPVPLQLKHADIGNNSIVTHSIFRHSSGHVIHLVVFYQRGDEQFLWHGSLPDVQQLGLTVTSVQFGRHDGAYNSIELVKVLLDNVRLRVPKHIPQFLAQISESHFINCDQQRTAQFQKDFGLVTNDEEAEPFRVAAHDVLSAANVVLNGLGVRFWISSGTCLGWFRQCDLIPYSRDVDIGIWITDYNDQLISGMQNNGLQLIHRFGKVEDSFELSFVAQEIKLDIFFFYEEADYMWNGGTQARTGKKFKYIFPKFSLCWTEFLNLKLRVPCDTLSYVEANYGTNWFQPVKSWDWKKSPSNVHENGEWPEEERRQVVQQFSL